MAMSVDIKLPRKYLLFHPLVWTLLGYMVWMFLPPFFTDRGHKWDVVIIDGIGICMLSAGYYLGTAVKRGLVPGWRLTLRPRDTNTLILAFFLVIYYVRLRLFSQIGIYALLHPYGRESSLIDTIAQTLTFPYIVLLMTMYILTKKRGYGGLLLLEFVLFIVPTLARSYYLALMLIFVFIRLFFFETKLSRLLKYLPAVAVLLALTALLGPYMHAVRSYAYIGAIERAEDLSFGTSEDASFIVDRLNVHGEAWSIEPVVDQAADIDRQALIGEFRKWSGLTAAYPIYPTTVANQIGLLVGYGVKTSTDFPRNYVLFHYPMGLVAVLTFNLLLGTVYGILYKLIFVKQNVLFLVMWYPIIYSSAFGEQGAMASTFIFQLLEIALATTVLWVTFMALKTLRRLCLHTARRPSHSNILAVATRGN